MLEERFANALHNTARAWRMALDRRLKHLGMSQASWLTIAMAAKASEPMSQIELAQGLGVEAATMVAMIDRLVKSGLLRREPSPHDRRVKLVVLTEEGNRVYGLVKTEAKTFRSQLLKNVDAGKLLVLTELLEQLQGVVESVT
jgi:MarR family transcriptional regulator for hemolysin